MNKLVLKPGKLKSDLHIGEIRVLKKEDLAILHEKRPVRIVQKLRDPHHKLARAIASGMKQKAAALACGYSENSVRTLMADPGFQQLVAEYRSIVTEAWKGEIDDYMELLTSNQMKAERQIAEHLEAADEAGELLPVNRLIAISRDAADRTGYGKRQTNLNVNVDFAAQLEKAINRSGKVINGSALAIPPNAGGGRVASPLHPQPVPQPFRRRVA